jgi:hypothetical protein
MSVKLAEAYIEKTIQESKEYQELGNIRQTLNTNIHSLDISKSSFEINNKLSISKLNPIALESAYNLFISLIEEKLTGRVFGSLELASSLMQKEKLKETESRCLLIKGQDTFLIGYNYRAIRDLLSIVSKNPLIVKSPLGADVVFEDLESGVLATNKAGQTTLKANLELGHTGAVTPLAEKIRLLSTTVNDPRIKKSLENTLAELVSVQAELGYKFLNKSDGSNLGGAIINLVIQPRDVNKKFSERETTVYRKFLNNVISHLKIENIPGSNTIVQDTRQFTKDKLVSAITGKKVNNVKKHSPVSNKLAIPKPKGKATSSTYKSTEKATPIKSMPSLISLQSLINQHLQNVISANMGSGTEKRILNYRTGRFAGSAKVESMSQSRQGMITAFYSYMKNPYQTFEPGFRQGSPKTRDPKLLISQSIREIAATRVGNQLRAVSL